MPIGTINALTQAELDEKCDDGDAVSLSPICHAEAGVKVVYTRRDGILHLFCARCEKALADVEVSP